MKQYDLFELIWKAQAPENSDVKADLQADFLYEDGEIVKVKGFYAGAETYKVRFLPVKTGKIMWKISGIINEEGTEFCETNENGTGLVKAVGTHFEYQNGKRFASFGTTIYALAHQDKDLIEETFASLAAAPFNKVRHCMFPKHYDYNHNEPQYYPFEKKEDGSWDTEHPCFAYWDHMEEIINRLGAMGIQSDLILFHPYDRWKFSEMNMEENLSYLDYLLRRFSAIPYIWWSLANEYDLCFAKSLDDWHTIEQYVHDNDPFGHLLSNHNCFQFYDFSRENITHCSLQSCAMHRAPEFMEKYGKPVVFDECCYEGDIQHSWGNITGFEMVSRFWQGAVQGAFVTHGETFYSEDEILWWSRGGKLKGKSAPKLAYLKEFMESLPGALEPWNDMEVINARKLKGTEEAAKVPIISLVCSTDAVDFEDMMWKDAVASGRIGEKVFIKYLGSHASRLFFLKLPENHKYKIEVIDVWEMTRTTLIEETSGETRCMLPGKEGIAVVATLIEGEKKG